MNKTIRESIFDLYMSGPTIGKVLQSKNTDMELLKAATNATEKILEYTFNAMILLRAKQHPHMRVLLKEKQGQEILFANVTVADYLGDATFGFIQSNFLKDLKIITKGIKFKITLGFLLTPMLSSHPLNMHGSGWAVDLIPTNMTIPEAVKKMTEANDKSILYFVCPGNHIHISKAKRLLRRHQYSNCLERAAAHPHTGAATPLGLVTNSLSPSAWHCHLPNPNL